MLSPALLGENITDVKLHDFVLAGQADEAGMSFRLTTMAEVKPKGGASILLCKGKIALVELRKSDPTESSGAAKTTFSFSKKRESIQWSSNFGPKWKRTMT